MSPVRGTVGTGHVRGGGRRGPRGYVFELTGGHPALDLANTLDLRPTAAPKELLCNYADLLDWGEQAGLLSATEKVALRRLATQRPREAQAALRRTRALREVIFALCSSVAAGKPLPAGPLASLTDAVREASVRLVLKPTAARAAWHWSRDVSLDRVRWAVARAAADLLTAPPRGPVRVCASETCDWLFLDLSRNKSRRWCDMAVCGNRAKVRRFYHARSPVS